MNICLILIEYLWIFIIFHICEYFKYCDYLNVVNHQSYLKIKSVSLKHNTEVENIFVNIAADRFGHELMYNDDLTMVQVNFDWESWTSFFLLQQTMRNRLKIILRDSARVLIRDEITWNEARALEEMMRFEKKRCCPALTGVSFYFWWPNR